MVWPKWRHNAVKIFFAMTADRIFDLLAHDWWTPKDYGIAHRNREKPRVKKKKKVSIRVLESRSCATQLILSLSHSSVWPCLKQAALWRESSPNTRQISLHGGNPGSQDCHQIHHTPFRSHTCRQNNARLPWTSRFLPLVRQFTHCWYEASNDGGSCVTQ